MWAMRYSGILDTQPGLGADRTGIGGVDTDDLFNFQLDLVRSAWGRSILLSSGSTSSPCSIAV